MRAAIATMRTGGGCQAGGDLIFESNFLGNAPNKTPNFRCGGADPKPWSINRNIPPRSQIEKNEFKADLSLNDFKAERSAIRHRDLDNSQKTRLVAAEIALPTQPDPAKPFVTFKLTEESTIDIALSISPMTLTLHTMALGGREAPLEILIQDFPQRLTLPAGQYEIRTQSQNHNSNTANSFLTLAADQFEWIGAQTTQIDMTLRGLTYTRFLTHSPEAEKTEILSLENRYGAILARNSNWRDYSYNWQVLRLAIDKKIPLPSDHSPAIFQDLPAGSYRIKTTASTTLYIATE